MLPGNSCPSNSAIKILCQRYILRKWFIVIKYRKNSFVNGKFTVLFPFLIPNQSLFLMKTGWNALKIAYSWKYAQIIIRLITFSECSVSEVFSVEESNAYTRFSANWTHYTCININFWTHSKKRQSQGIEPIIILF